jgi:imidazolonepropionase-like amidohydrolase
MLHHELGVYVRAGIAPAEVLRMATSTSAEVMGVDGNRGTIAAGRYADMVLVDGDPTKDIGDIRNIDLVVKGGRMYDPPAIERAIGITPRD